MHEAQLVGRTARAGDVPALRRLLLPQTQQLPFDDRELMVFRRRLLVLSLAVRVAGRSSEDDAEARIGLAGALLKLL